MSNLPEGESKLHFLRGLLRKNCLWGPFRRHSGLKETGVESTRVSGERCVSQKASKGRDGEMCGACSCHMALSAGVMYLRPLLIQVNGKIRQKGVVFQGRVNNKCSSSI